jgi:ACS family hexuronate transporter-like MFS transporter
MGATFGATVAPYLVIPLATFSYAETMPALANWFGQGTGWRIAFLLTGAMGLAWLVPWLGLYRQPRHSKQISAAELQLIEADATAENSAAAAAANAWTWKQVFLFRGTWLLLLARLITDPVWYFYQFWFPKYLSADRQLSQEQLKITWIIYAAAGVGSVLGGWLSGRMVKRGAIPAASRLWVMMGCAGLMPLSPFIAHAAGLDVAMILTVITVLASLAWLINLSALVVDIVPKHSLGTVFSVVAAGSTLGGIIMNTMVSMMVSGPSSKPAGFLDQGIQSVFGGVLQLVQGAGYAQWFLIMAFLHPVAWGVLRLGGIHHLTPNQPTHPMANHA